MKYDPNVYGYVNGKPTYSRDEFIFTARGFGPIENDADLLAFAEKVTSRWYNAGWHQTFTTYYLSDYALSEPGRSLTVKEFNRLKELQQAAREGSGRRPRVETSSDDLLGRQQRRGDLDRQERSYQERHDRRPARRRLLRKGGIDMAALRDIARDVAEEIRDGIGWVIVYRTGRSWSALTLWSDLGSGEWETDDLNDAIGILKTDPDAVVLNGYYCGHFGEGMTIDEIAAGIRWHYEGGHNRLADYYEVEQGLNAIEEARKTAEAAGLPFCERLADGPDDELDPYTYDGSMSLGDYEAMQDARTAREELAAVVAAQAPGLPAEKLDELAAAAAGLHISPETMQQILEAFDRVAEAVKEMARALMEAFKPIIDWAKKTAERFMDALAAGIVPRKWLHLAKHAKKARTRKKYRNRIRRAVFAALAAEGGGSS